MSVAFVYLLTVCWPFSHSVFACQDVSTALGCCVCWLIFLQLWFPGCGCHPLFIPLTVCWPLSHGVSCSSGCECHVHPIHCLLTSLWFCLCLSGCECCPFFCSVPIFWPFSVLACQKVSASHWSCLLSANFSFALLTSLWVLLFVDPACSPLTFLLLCLCFSGCVCHSSSPSLHADLSQSVSVF